jgi:DNA invertase Pin-like site-specific DNA recombinase
MLTVLGGLAEFERELICARTTKGRRGAVAHGAKLGRRPGLTPHQMKEAIRRRVRGKGTLREIARGHNGFHCTISRLEA